jgi:hypothetical protein
MFTQDIENEVFTKKADAFSQKDPNSKISSQQRSYFYAVASSNGWTKTEAKKFLEENGYKSAADITVGALDALCEKLREGKVIEVEVTE